MRKDIGRPQGNDTQAGVGSHQAVGDLGDRAVAAGGNDHVGTAPRGLPGERFSVAGTMGFRQIQSDPVCDKDIQHAP